MTDIQVLVNDDSVVAAVKGRKLVTAPLVKDNHKSLIVRLSKGGQPNDVKRKKVRDLVTEV